MSFCMKRLCMMSFVNNACARNSYLIMLHPVDAISVWSEACNCLQVSKNLPNIAQKTDIAPESIGADANVRN